MNRGSHRWVRLGERTMVAVTEKEIEATFRESEYILRRWEFGVAGAGLLWIKPLQPKFTPEELAAILQLLAEVCQDDQTTLIRLDLSDSMVAGAQWTLVDGLLVDFAKRIDAVIRMAQGAGRPASSILFCRGGRAGENPQLN